MLPFNLLPQSFKSFPSTGVYPYKASPFDGALPGLKLAFSKGLLQSSALTVNIVNNNIYTIIYF
jgi:hypothetical protein